MISCSLMEKGGKGGGNPKSNTSRIEPRLENHNGLSHLRFSDIDINDGEVTLLTVHHLSDLKM